MKLIFFRSISEQHMSFNESTGGRASTHRTVMHKRMKKNERRMKNENRIRCWFAIPSFICYVFFVLFFSSYLSSLVFFSSVHTIFSIAFILILVIIPTHKCDHTLAWVLSLFYLLKSKVVSHFVDVWRGVQ